MQSHRREKEGARGATALQVEDRGAGEIGEQGVAGRSIYREAETRADSCGKSHVERSPCGSYVVSAVAPLSSPVLRPPHMVPVTVSEGPQGHG